MVYFVQPVGGGPVKIGHSDNVPARVRQLESAYKQPLAILATMKGGYDEEQVIHARFASLRLGRTEQFQPGPELMAFIGRPLLVAANAKTVEAMDVSVRSLASLKGTGEAEAWLDGLAKFVGLSTRVSVIWQALKEYADHHGFDRPMPR